MDHKHSFDEVPAAQPDFGDVANQSGQQQLAFETWVNTALNMMERGQTDTEILAKLSHDGCPDPEGVMLRAKMQPVESEPNEEELSGMSGREDIFRPTGEEEGMEESQAIQASVRYVPTSEEPRRVKAAGVPGTLVGEYESYGVHMVRVALDTGDVMDVTAEHVKPFEEETILGQIQTFVDGFPEVEHTAHSIQAHMKDWGKVQAACEAYAPSAKSDYERIQYSVIHRLANTRIAELESVIVEANPHHTAIVEGQVPYTSSVARHHTERGSVDVDRLVSEKAPIWVSELHASVIDSPEIVADSAREHVASLTHGMDRQFVASLTERFVAAAEGWRAQRAAEEASAPTPKTASQDLPDLPDDALYL